MFHNYFFLRKLAAELHEQIVGFSLGECYSQNKNELILGFFNGKHELFIKANLDPKVSLIDIMPVHHRAKKNSVNLFESLLDKKVESVSVFENERSFYIQFENETQLVFKMHGSRSNILIMRDKKTSELFRTILVNDLSLTISDLNKKLDLSEGHFIRSDGDISKFYPPAGKEIRSYLHLEGYGQLANKEKWKKWLETLEKLETPRFKVTFKKNNYQMTLLPTSNDVIFEAKSAIEAAQYFYRAFTKHYYLNEAKSKKEQQLNGIIKRTKNYLKKTEDKLIQIQQKRGFDEIANILMANLHQVEKGEKHVTLDDFYNNNEPITIKLNPQLSTQINAEKFYRKSKNQALEINNLEENLAKRRAELEKAVEELEKVERTDDIKSIRNLKPESLENKKQPSPFHCIEFKGFSIFVGKHAKNNDELTLKNAKKDDLWLHAKDVAGSHVVIKQKPGTNFPKDVIEYAAEIAASFSKRKTDSLCPVIYTPKKYVRKRKGDPPGAVIVDKESVMMVKPSNHLTSTS